MGTGRQGCEVQWAVCLRGSALEHREAGSECVMESESCQTIVLQWSQGTGGGLGSCWGRKDESVKGWGSQGGQSPQPEGQRGESPSLGGQVGPGQGCWDSPGPWSLKAVPQDLERDRKRRIRGASSPTLSHLSGNTSKQG